jgi:hypothetical protein
MQEQVLRHVMADDRRLISLDSAQSQGPYGVEAINRMHPQSRKPTLANP